VFQTKFNAKGINEAINLARIGRSILGWKRVLTVEEILGKILQLELHEVLAGLDDYGRISYKTFYPEWFVHYCIRLMGRKEGLQFLNYSASSPIYVRLNALLADEKALHQQITESGIILNKVEAVPYLYQVSKNKDTRVLTSLEIYKTGSFILQEKTSCLASLLGEPNIKQTILTVGVETIRIAQYIAQLLRNKGRIIAMMQSPHQLARAKHEVRRQGIQIVEPVLMKTKKLSKPVDQVDLIVFGPKSSGTGIFWRRPSLKWKTSFKTITDSARTQWNALNTYAEHLTENGCLIYWTKSVTVEENEMIIERFLKQHPEFILLPSVPSIGVPAYRGQLECQRLYPHLHTTDGSFFAKLQKQ
jgi:16S rRNA (cytosine967-C5)-methyltransferase